MQLRHIRSTMEKCGKTIVTISLHQMRKYCGNVLGLFAIFVLLAGADLGSIRWGCVEGGGVWVLHFQKKKLKILTTFFFFA